MQVWVRWRVAAGVGDTYHRWGGGTPRRRSGSTGTVVGRGNVERQGTSRGNPVTGIDIRRFDAPDETRSFEKVKFDIVKIGGLTVGRASYDPGWKWSEHVRPVAGTRSCEVEHVGLVLSGRAKVRMDDGVEIELRPGDLFAIAPGHDSWVVGDAPYVSLHFLGAGAYAR